MEASQSYKIEKQSSELEVHFVSSNVIQFSDPEAAQALIQDVLEHDDASIEQVVFNVRELNRVNSAFLGIFVQMSKTLHNLDKSFGVRGANPAIRKIMELTKLTPMMLD
ncbi:STAS domain-containing protein [bacterium]|nr:STAS domain-containing protein [bacterium]